MKYRVGITLVIVLALCLPAAGHAAGAPGAPADLKLSIEGKGFLLTWKSSPDDPGSVTGYEVARAELASGPFKTVAKVKKGAVKYADKKAKPEIIYYYKVRAVAGKAHSPYSNTVTGELPGN
jgi:streptogramin lyase